MNHEEIKIFHEYDIDFNSRTITLFGDVTFRLSDIAIKNLHLLNQESNELITIILNSDGGEVIQGKAIIDAIQASKSPTRIIATGACMSMGVMILQAADERIISPGCTIMIHNSDANKDTSRKTTDQNWKKYYKKLDEEDVEILLKKMKAKDPKASKAKLKKMLKYDTILSAKEAVDLGFADKILD